MQTQAKENIYHQQLLLWELLRTDRAIKLNIVYKGQAALQSKIIFHNDLQTNHLTVLRLNCLDNYIPATGRRINITLRTRWRHMEPLQKNKTVCTNTWFLRQLWYMEASLWWMVAARYWQRGCRADTVSTSQYFKDFIMASLTSFSIYKIKQKDVGWLLWN